MRNGPRANGRTFGPQRLLDSRDPVRWTGLGKRLSLRPEECVKHPSKPKRSTITVDRKVRQVMGARLAVSCLGNRLLARLRLHRPRGVQPTATVQFPQFSVPFWEKSASNRVTCRGVGDRSGEADRLPAFGWSSFVHEGRQRSLCRVDAIPPLIRKQMHIYPAAGPKPRTYALLTEEAKPAAFACKRRGEAPIICLAQSNGLGYRIQKERIGPTARPFVPTCARTFAMR